jgi:hypothetical protein
MDRLVISRHLINNQQQPQAQPQPQQQAQPQPQQQAQQGGRGGKQAQAPPQPPQQQQAQAQAQTQPQQQAQQGGRGGKQPQAQATPPQQQHAQAQPQQKPPVVVVVASEPLPQRQQGGKKQPTQQGMPASLSHTLTHSLLSLSSLSLSCFLSCCHKDNTAAKSCTYIY